MSEAKAKFLGVKRGELDRICTVAGGLRGPTPRVWNGLPCAAIEELEFVLCRGENARAVVEEVELHLADAARVPKSTAMKSARLVDAAVAQRLGGWSVNQA